MARRYEYLFDIFRLLGADTQYLWTGDVELTIGTQTWRPTNLVESVQMVGGQLADSETRISIVLFAPTETERLGFLVDPGPVSVTVRQVVSTDEGTTWTLVPRAFTGRLASAELRGARYHLELVDRRGDPLRPRPRYWSDEDQQRRHPGDTGLQYMKLIATGVEVRWP